MVYLIIYKYTAPKKPIAQSGPGTQAPTHIGGPWAQPGANKHYKLTA